METLGGFPNLEQRVVFTQGLVGDDGDLIVAWRGHEGDDALALEEAQDALAGAFDSLTWEPWEGSRRTNSPAASTGHLGDNAWAGDGPAAGGWAAATCGDSGARLAVTGIGPDARFGAAGTGSAAGLGAAGCDADSQVRAVGSMPGVGAGAEATSSASSSSPPEIDAPGAIKEMSSSRVLGTSGEREVRKRVGSRWSESLKTTSFSKPSGPIFLPT